MNSPRHAVAMEAARIVCQELVTDYGQAKKKAAQRLGLGSRAAMPENAQIHAAIVDYQRLFGGAGYLAHLQRMRLTAVKMMQWLADFSPRLVGGAVSGAVTQAHHVQLHLFADKPEMLDIFLHDHGVRFSQQERNYRYPDGAEKQIPLACFEVNGIGVDVAVFPEGEMKRPPVNPADGLPYKRLNPGEAEKLGA